MENPFAPSKRLFGDSTPRGKCAAGVPRAQLRGERCNQNHPTSDPLGSRTGIPGGWKRCDGCRSSWGEDVGTACAVPEPNSSQSHEEPERSITRH